MDTNKLALISGAITLLIFFLIIWGIARAIKKFVYGVIDHAKGTAPRTDASKVKYTVEARRAYEEVTPKRQRDQKPPWEQ